MSYGKLTTLLMSILIAVVGLCMNLMADTDYGEEILEKRTESSRTYYKNGVYTCIIIPENNLQEKYVINRRSIDSYTPSSFYSVRQYPNGGFGKYIDHSPVGAGYIPGYDPLWMMRGIIEWNISNIDDSMQIYGHEIFQLTTDEIHLYSHDSIVIQLNNCSSFGSIINLNDSLRWIRVDDGNYISQFSVYTESPQSQSFSIDLVEGIQNSLPYGRLVIGLQGTIEYDQGWVNLSDIPSLTIHFGERMIASGELYKDQIWSYPHTLTGNLTVPTGITLTINSSVDLQGHTLLSTGGTIILGPNGSVNPHYCIKQNNLIKGFYPSFETALNNVVTGQKIEVGEVYILTQDVTLPAGVVFQFLGTVSLGGHWLYAPGSICYPVTVNGCAAKVTSSPYGPYTGLYPTLNSALTYAQEGQTIELYASTYSQNITLNGVSLLGQGSGSTIINGNISASGNGIIVIEGLSITNRSISMNNCQGWITDIVSNSNYSVIYGYNSPSLSVDNFDSNNNNSQSVTITAANCALCANSNHIHNSEYGIIVSGSSTLYSRINWYCGNELGDINNQTANTIESVDDQLSDIPSRSILGYKIVTDYTVCGQLMKKSGNQLMDELQKSISDNGESINEIDTDYHLFIQSLNQERKKNPKYNISESKNVILGFIEKYNKLINDGLSFEENNRIISRIVRCYRLMEDWDGLKLILDQFSQSNKDQKRIPYLKRQEVYYYLGVKDYRSALSVISELRKSGIEDKTLLGELIYEEGLIHKYNLKEPLQARIAFEELMKGYPDHPLSKFAETESQDLVSQDEWNRYLEDKKTDNGTEEVGFSCSSYPNPFNLSTRIQYAIPKYGQVQVVVYDLLGRMVRELVKQDQGKGQYEVEWNGCNQNGAPVSSGIYFYRVQWNNRAHSDKLIMLK
ncbi:MAG: T9SS type A sorting domain-containing protein [Candidatus Delongbacteria bacterium]|nr:T9SS type A sorting domain-containing protein [Candidatus Delongbacteria bacterium]